VASVLAGVPRAVAVRAVRSAVAAARDAPDAAPQGPAAWARAVASALLAATRPTLRRCINATGVVLHTNLGRAPLAEAARRALADVAPGYSTLEYDPERGARGDRHVHCAGLVTELTGAAGAMVVNNAASALLLALAAAAAGGDVIVSRGELIEIGGGFRIPEILATSGARLLEVGTKSIRFVHEMRDGVTGELCATSELVGVHIDAQARKSRPLPEATAARARELLGNPELAAR